MWFNTGFHENYGNETDAIKEWIFKDLCSESERQYIGRNSKCRNAAAGVFRTHYFDFVRRTRFAWCWFESCRESAAMWNCYGHQGVAIQSSVAKVRGLFEGKDWPLVYGRMIYVAAQNGMSHDFNPKKDTELLLRPYFLKRQEYESEKEVRFVTAAGQDYGRGGLILRDVKPQDWISAIRLWPGLTNDEAKAIQRAIEPLYPKVDCARSDLLSRPEGGSGALDFLLASVERAPEKSWASGIPAELRTP